jgi:hypothetical protein
MKLSPRSVTADPESEPCRQVRDLLISNWLEESENWPLTLLDHLRQCRSCLGSWIALEAAADLAGRDWSGGPSHRDAGIDSCSAGFIAPDHPTMWRRP